MGGIITVVSTIFFISVLNVVGGLAIGLLIFLLTLNWD